MSLWTMQYFEHSNWNMVSETGRVRNVIWDEEINIAIATNNMVDSLILIQL